MASMLGMIQVFNSLGAATLSL